MGVTSVLEGYNHQRKSHVLLRLVQMKRHLLKNALFVYEMWPLFVFKRKGNEFFWKTLTKFLFPAIHVQSLFW